MSEVLWSEIDSDLAMAMNYAMLHQLQDNNSEKVNKQESFYVNQKDKEQMP